MSVGEIAETDRKMKGGRTQGSGSRSSKNLHRQTSSSTEFRIFAATGIDVIYPLSLSLSFSFSRLFSIFLPQTKRHPRISTEPETSVSFNWRSYFLSFLVHFLFLCILRRIRLIVHLFLREYFERVKESRKVLYYYVSCYITPLE